MRYGLFILLLFVQVLVFGQKSGSISGKVLDSENNIVEFVNVFLTSVNDSTRIVNGTVTDNTGSFAFTNVPLGKYFIQFRFVGFVNHQRILPPHPSPSGQARRSRLRRCARRAVPAAVRERSIPAARLPMREDRPRRWRVRRRAPPAAGPFVVQGWRCGESNPGPVTRIQDFSGRSLLMAFLGPSSHADMLLTGPVI